MDISPRRSSLLHGCENSGKPAPDKGFRVTFPVQTGAVSYYNAFPEFGGGPLRSRFGSIHLCRLWFFLLATFTAAQTAEQRTARYFESVRKRPQLLLAFLKDLPKGGDLHNHLEGAIYAEDWVDFAAEDNLCVDRTTSRLIAPPCDSCESYTAKPAMRCAYGDHILYNQTIDAWSMRNWRPGEESGHDHFFATFEKFRLAFHGHVGEGVAAAANRAGQDHLQYVEFMHTADGGQAAQIAAKAGWADDFGKMRESLLAAGLKDVAAATDKKLEADEARAHDVMKCGTAEAAPGCGVTVRYLYQVLRGLPHEIVFAQILLGFELASSHPRFVGLNLVMPEDWYVPLHDFNQHMAMLDYLHTVYPKVHISLHAGEIAMGLVPPEDLTFHIRASMEKGHAERIGHGVDVMNERGPLDLLKEMAARNVLVEISLTSNDMILGVTGDDHPLPIYMHYGVPVAISTDDEGVARSDMTHEYLRAVQGYNLSYPEVKRMARQSLEHSFLPGESLWTETKLRFRFVTACAGDAAGAGKPSSGCQKFLVANERARVQWKLEAEFAMFEKKF
ncbi:MAG: adenosine deaminase [Acidobacteria bacterium]|nr:MAG: adenosine deaminase [Acidobacteriota bacterium]